MKNLMKLLPFLLIVAALPLIHSCSKSDEAVMGKVEFSISMDEISDAKSLVESDSAAVAYHLMISVESADGKEIFSDELIPLYSFGAGFVSEKVELPSGKLKLTKFMVINASGAVVYAAPKAGSEMAYLAIRPLPILFTVEPGMTARVVPEVLPVMNFTPDQFGYVNFGVQIIKPLTFYTVAILDNPLIMAPTSAAPVQWTQAKLTVLDNKGWRYSFRLEAGINKIIVRGGTEMYTLIVEKEGFTTVRLQVPADKLRETSRENPLVLKIPWGQTNMNTLVLQPGPEAGKDAMISNLSPDKNFGSHPYFEATFLSEPILTVMRSNRSLIFFNLGQVPKSAIIKNVSLQLSYEVPLPWPNDSAITAIPGTEKWFGAVLQQIVEPWEEYGVTWENQPRTIDANQVYITPFIRNANFITVDVTRLFINNIDSPNHGMLFKHYPSEKFPGFRFASSDHKNSVLRPKLIINYTLPAVVVPN
jgi:hypothetical protein